MKVSFDLSIDEKEALARLDVVRLHFEEVGVRIPGGFHVVDGGLIKTVTLTVPNIQGLPERVIDWIKTGQIIK